LLQQADPANSASGQSPNDAVLAQDNAAVQAQYDAAVAANNRADSWFNDGVFYPRQQDANAQPVLFQSAPVVLAPAATPPVIVGGAVVLGVGALGLGGYTAYNWPDETAAATTQFGPAFGVGFVAGEHLYDNLFGPASPTTTATPLPAAPTPVTGDPDLPSPPPLIVAPQVDPLTQINYNNYVASGGLRTLWDWQAAGMPSPLDEILSAPIGPGPVTPYLYAPNTAELETEAAAVTAAKQPSFVLGASDGGPGTWVESPKYPTDPADAAFQQSATGAPAGVEYAVPTNQLPSGIKYFDGFDPQTGNLIDAKNYINWPQENLGFSIDAATAELGQSDAIAGELGTTLEVRVATQAKADLLQSIVNRQGFENTIIRYWGN
jgi:hypothetical protein